MASGNLAIHLVRSGSVFFDPSIYGKANTLAQIIAVAAVLLQQLTPALWVSVFRTFALDLTMVLTVASGLHYAWSVSRRLAGPQTNGSNGTSGTNLTSGSSGSGGINGPGNSGAK